MSFLLLKMKENFNLVDTTLLYHIFYLCDFLSPNLIGEEKPNINELLIHMCINRIKVHGLVQESLTFSHFTRRKLNM